MYNKAYLWYKSQSNVDDGDNEQDNGPRNICKFDTRRIANGYKCCNYKQKTRTIDNRNRLSRVIENIHFEFSDHESQ